MFVYVDKCAAVVLIYLYFIIYITWYDIICVCVILCVYNNNPHSIINVSSHMLVQEVAGSVFPDLHIYILKPAVDFGQS